ncbi:MAG: hypothetical protein EXQ95_09570 [Alphaproteobacteria bacterium]|nr:hypothetical protein [Alphaproteobacteria bacterium]
MKRLDWRRLLGSVGIAVLGFAAGEALAQSTLRIVPQADLKILDTVWTTNNVTSNHGYLVPGITDPRNGL